MMNLKMKLFLAAFLLPGMLICVHAQKSVDLRYNVSSGDRYTMTMEIDQDIVFEANGQQMALDQMINFKLLSEVSEATADSIKLKHQLNAVKMTQGIFGMTVTYDSEDPATLQNPMAAKVGEQFTAIIGQSFFMNMDKKGNVGSMDMRNVTDNDDFADNLNSGGQFVAFPDGKVKVGESWEKDIFASDESNMKFNAVYTLLKVTGKEATIGLEATIKANPNDDSDLNLSGTQTGEMIVDLKTGWLIESTTSQDLELEVEQNGQKYPATISGTIKTVCARAE
jgi:hypothetical protein